MTCQINEFSQLKEGMTNIHYEGNETLEPNILPSSLHSIIFGHKFNNGTDYWAVVKNHYLLEYSRMNFNISHLELF